MNKKMTKLFASILSCGMLMLSILPAYAAETGDAEVLSREEVVYAVLDGDSAVKNMYVVNILNISKSGIFLDYGSYTSVKNLTTAEKLYYDAGGISAYASEGRFFYQGNPDSKDLPWNIAVLYYLDGERIQPTELAGKSGHLDIRLDTSANPKVNPGFYENYLLQISITLNTDYCTNITASGASTANAGANKIITFTVMPNTVGHIAVSADVTDFEMSGISVNAVPFSMNVDVDTSSLGGELGLLEDAIALLDNGVAELTGGIKQLNDGAAEFRAGSSEFKVGIDMVNGNTGEIVEASKSILSALQFMSVAVKGSTSDDTMQSLSQLPAGLLQLADGLDEMSAGVPELSTALTAAVSALDAAFEMMPAETLDEDAMQTLYMNNPDDEALSLLADYYMAAQILNATYKEIAPVFTVVQSNFQTIGESVETISTNLKSIAEQISSAAKASDISSSMAQLSGGLSELADNYQKFQEGLESYAQGVTQLTDAYSGINTGSTELASGINEVYNASAQLSAGMTEFNSQTKGLTEQMNSAIGDVLATYDKSGFIPVSFVSESNENTVAVQFVIQTEKIAKEKVITHETNETENENFWSRLKALFN